MDVTNTSPCAARQALAPCVAQLSWRFGPRRVQFKNSAAHRLYSPRSRPMRENDVYIKVVIVKPGTGGQKVGK